MPTLEIKDLHVSVKDKEILKGLSLKIDSLQTIALLGPNGNGKSTLLQTIMGNPNYVVTKGQILFDGHDITNLEVNERSKLGIFLGMQYPSEVPGVNNSDFLKASLNAHREKPVSLFEFYKVLNNAYERTNIPFELSNRNLNEGFSGGEKKKNEILQMLVLNPSLVMLDEIDSGLDVDAVQVVAKILSEEQSKRGFLIVSHYARLYEMINVDRVIILVNGKIVMDGGKELINKIDSEGYEWLKKSAGIEFDKNEKMNQVSIGTCATKEILKGK
ncbi:MAG: Fe-S cluster assembly ATPase SufC [Bacilli bacterium]|nr:Fe-S cluster assembly ATPase SufC [Bacilli bacterium]